jgi:hypothetical protein
MRQLRTVYILQCPWSHYAFWVGITRDPEILKQPISRWAYSKGNPEKNKWVRDILATGVKPVVRIMATTSPRLARKIQKDWIERLSRHAKPLNIDKSKKARDISLALWGDINFALKVKAGIQRRKERLETCKLKATSEAPAPTI